MGTELNSCLQTSHGCIYKCVFCSGPAMFKNKVRYHSIERVINDLEIVYENLGDSTKTWRVDLWDDNFCLDRKRTLALCEAIIKEGLKLNFHAEVRADHVNRELLGLMFEAGIREINFSLESGVPRILRILKKVNGKTPDFREEKIISKRSGRRSNIVKRWVLLQQ